MARHSRTRRRWPLVVAVLLLAGLITPVALFWAQGYRPYVVHTGSMEPTYLPGDLVVDRPVDGPVHVGDVITFRHSDITPDLVTHRVVGVTRTGLIHTKGDANATADVWEIRPDQVVGRVAWSVSRGGYAAVFLQQPAGVAAFATALLAIVLLWGLFFPAPATPSTTTTSSSRATRTTPRPRRPRPVPRPTPGRHPAPQTVANLDELDMMLQATEPSETHEAGESSSRLRRAGVLVP